MAGDVDELAFLHVEIDIPQCMRVRPRVGFGDLLKLDHSAVTLPCLLLLLVDYFSYLFLGEQHESYTMLTLNADAHRTAFQLRTVMDGIWLRASFQTQPMPGARGVDEVDYAARHLMNTDPAAMTAARDKMQHLAAVMLTTRAFRERAMTG